MKLVTRKALVRLSVAFAALGFIIIYVVNSMFSMPGKSYSGPLPPLEEEEIQLRLRLRRHVERLAGEIGERHVFRPEKLEAAAAYVEGELGGLGYSVSREVFEARGVPCSNIVVEIPGSHRSRGIVVAGAHYDTCPGTPGANDNATGVGALIELARSLRGVSLSRTMRLVAFTNEEPPFFQTEEMGSLVHARASRRRGDAIIAMVSIETIGYYRDDAKSQTYPPPFSLLYPDVGDFISFVGNYRSRSLVREAIAHFRETTRFPSQGGAPPGVIPGVGWSDHWSFWKAGFPAIMVTDTAPFRYPYYHTEGDTPDRIDYDRMARVVAGLARVMDHLAGREP